LEWAVEFYWEQPSEVCLKRTIRNDHNERQQNEDWIAGLGKRRRHQAIYGASRRISQCGARGYVNSDDNEGRDYSSLAQRYGFLLNSVPLPMTDHPEDAAIIWQAIISADNPIKQAEMIMTHGFDPAMEDMYAAGRDLCVGKDLVFNCIIKHYITRRAIMAKGQQRKSKEAKKPKKKPTPAI
jgi:hypothetical protein